LSERLGSISSIREELLACGAAVERS